MGIHDARVDATCPRCQRVFLSRLPVVASLITGKGCCWCVTGETPPQQVKTDEEGRYLQPLNMNKSGGWGGPKGSRA